jgi:hypothetical protein
MLPVQPIEQVTDSFNQNKTIISIVSEQKIQPWYNALLQLLSNRELYYKQSKLVRSAAHQFVSKIEIEDFEDFLMSIVLN